MWNYIFLTFPLGNLLLRGKTIIFSLNLWNKKDLINLTFPRKPNWIIHCCWGHKTSERGRVSSMILLWFWNTSSRRRVKNSKYSFSAGVSCTNIFIYVLICLKSSVHTCFVHFYTTNSPWTLKALIKYISNIWVLGYFLEF